MSTQLSILDSCSTLYIYIRGITVHVFVPNRHGTDTSVRLQRCTTVHKCGIHSVNMANVKACFAMQNLKLEVGVPPGPFSLRLGSHVRSSRERNCVCGLMASEQKANCMANDNRKVITKWRKTSGQVESCVQTLFNSDRLCKWQHIEHASRGLTLTAPDKLAVTLRG